jgi:hypothetical protein
VQKDVVQVGFLALQLDLKAQQALLARLDLLAFKA